MFHDFASSFDSLTGCAPREKTYLSYRYGYLNDEERTKAETREHFGLSETRAEKLERQACGQFKENYLEIQRKTEKCLRRSERKSAAPHTNSDRRMIIQWV